MSKIVSQLMEGYSWISGISTINTILFTLLFAAIIIGVLRMKKSDVEEYKNMPLENNDTDLI
jgi:cbb3-type cytochrome oxidase subunit 3